MGGKEPLQRRDIEAITGALGSENEVVQGTVPGIGRRFTFGRRDVTCDLYEDPPFVRVSSGSLRAEITGARLVGVTDSGVIFEGTAPGEIVKLRLEPDGGVTIFAGPEPLPEVVANARIEDPAPAPPPPSLTESPQPTARRSTRRAQGATDTDAEAPNPRIELSGTCVTTPTFHRSAKQGKLIGEFTVEVETAAGERQQHHVVVFDERARQLRGVLGEGDAVDVKGNLHTTQVVGDDGNPFEKTEVYAFLIKPR